MPVTYTFATFVSMPVGTEFDCAEIGEAEMPQILSMDEVTASRGAPHFSIDGDNDLVIYSDDGTLSSLVLELPLGESHTFETTFTPSELPSNLSSLDSFRFFLGTYDKQNNASGVLLSKEGLALAAYYGSSAMILPGSQDVFEEGTKYTLRLVVDGEQNIMYLYVTETALLDSTGHVLRYISAAPVTEVGSIDSIRIEIMGQADKAITGKFSTIRVACLSALVPNQRPIADAGADQTANIGSAVVHDGRNSYDPEGVALTYDWKLKDAPDGSRFKSSGTGGSTIDDGDADGFTTVFDGGTGAFSADNTPLLQPGDHLLIGSTYYEVATTRWLLDTETGKYVRDTSGAWNNDEIVVTTDTISDSLSGEAWYVLHSATYFSDCTQSYPSAIPDKVGVYVVGLVVNDGSLDSLENEALLNTASTSVVLGCTPDVSWTWRHLSDFWNLLEDREIVGTVWSGFAQACAAQLLTAWQIDYNKSLLDIQRVFQRRWLDYSTLLDESSTDDVTIRINRGPLVSSDLTGGVNCNGKTLQLVLDADSIKTVTFVGTDPMTAEQLADQINAEMGFANSPVKLANVVSGSTHLVLEHGTLLRIRPGGTANTLLGFSTTEYTNNDLSGSSGSAVSATRLTAFEASDPPTIDYVEQGVTGDDLLVVSGVGYRVQKTALDSATGTANTGLTLVDALPDDSSYSWAIPSVVISEDLNFTDELVVAGDLARFAVKNNTTGEVTEVLCEVAGVREDRAGFDPQPLLEHYAGVPSNYTTTFLGIKHLTYIPVDDLVEEIPVLQEVIKNASLKLAQNLDYYIEDVTVGAETVRAIRIKEGTFTLLDPPPDGYWAETTYLDNRPTIEANFGRMVNFKLEDLEDRTDGLDYLSAVRGLWWSYFGGPAVSKVRTGVQILLGLPFSEVDGIVQDIEPNFSTDEGRITIQDQSNADVIRTYYYPRNAGLVTNDATGATLAEGDEITQFHSLCGGVEVLDWVNAADWMASYVSQGNYLELEKYFTWMIRADVDTFSLTNLIFAVDFAKKITPHYTTNLFVLLKNMSASEVDVTDTLDIDLTMTLYETFCSGEPGSYNWDATDGSGEYLHAFDSGETPPPFFDTNRLCPAESAWVVIAYTHPGGSGWLFDTIWAYDDGDTDGDASSDDLIPLSGPDTDPPAPYGPAVGVISFDDTVTAGVYTRSKTIA